MKTPTLGYPTQEEAIIALYVEGFAPKLIALRAETSINSVYRAITFYRQAGGEAVEPTMFAAPEVFDHLPQANNVWAKARMTAGGYSTAGRPKLRVRQGWHSNEPYPIHPSWPVQRRILYGADHRSPALHPVANRPLD